jgi:hypothetical protein
LNTLSTAFFPTVRGDADEVQLLPWHGPYRGTVVEVVAGVEELPGEHRDGHPAVDGMGVRRGHDIAVAGVHQHWLAEHWTNGRPTTPTLLPTRS